MAKGLSTSPILRHGRSGFTLMELSIVIVIIGLIVGGIIVGKSMIRTSQVRSIITDYRTYSSAIASFREKYNYLPGDMPNATDYWGINPGGCPNPAYDGVKKVATCNGNGDGFISTWTSGWADFYEQFAAWQHLSDAGLIGDMYVGVRTSGTQNATAGMNVPRASIPNGIWTFYPLGDTWDYGSASTFANDYTSTLIISEPLHTSSGLDVISTILSPAEAYSIDSKIDDGKPGFGLVSSWKDGGLGFHCLTSDIQTTSEYAINSGDGPNCSLIFKFD